MKNLKDLDRFRQPAMELSYYGDIGGETCGCFVIPSPNRTIHAHLRVIASSGDGWDHVSVSTNVGRTPTWLEMDYIKRMFFKKNETAMQLHVPVKDHINNHEHTLHLWRPLNAEIPRPPARMV